MMTQLYLQVAGSGSFFFAFYDPQGYSGGIPTHLLTTVLSDCYALLQYGFILYIQLTTHIFVELPNNSLVRTETCSSHWNKQIIKSYLGLFY
jgi:hypothetical protein